MLRLLKLLILTTLMLPLLAGTVAVAFGFGDPWGMGGKDPWGIFLTAALPILPPGLYHAITWPATYGVAVLLSPLAAYKNGHWYVGALLFYLAAVALAWSITWARAPDVLNLLIEGRSYVPGQLVRSVWKLGVYLLIDSASAAATIAWWRWRR